MGVWQVKPCMQKLKIQTPYAKSTDKNMHKEIQKK